MQQEITLSSSGFYKNPYWSKSIELETCPSANMLDLFDQNGYDLCELEICYSVINDNRHSIHRNHTHVALKFPWFTQNTCVEGAVLNHSLLFERKGYNCDALVQLEGWAKTNPLVWKVAKYRPKWGLDFSMDYADRDGNVFEILHYEYDGFNLNEIQDRKDFLDKHLLNIDWNHAAKCLLNRKSEWYNLDFFAQSLYKCNYFGIGPERFKMVAWE